MTKYLLLIVVLFLTGCFPSPTTFNGKYTPKVAAEKNLTWATEAMKKGYFEEANRYLEFVKRNYPYQMEIQEKVQLMYGDIHYYQENYIDAVELYQSFIRRFPQSKLVPLAQFKISKSYVQEIPSDFVLFPPPYERDKEAIRNAQKALNFFIGNYPKDQNITEAKKLRLKMINYLAHYEYYVGNFYYDHSKYQGAVWRFEGLLQTYPESTYISDALYKTVLSYHELKKKDKRDHYAQLFFKKFPGSDKIKEIKKLIKL